MPATAGVHRRDELKARRIADAVISPGDSHFASFERLAQTVEHLRLEFRQFVEEEHALMGERDFAGAGMRTAADERRHRGRMMRRTERTPVGERACGPFINRLWPPAAAISRARLALSWPLMSRR